jgi:hypothetical protein
VKHECFNCGNELTIPRTDTWGPMLYCENCELIFRQHPQLVDVLVPDTEFVLSEIIRLRGLMDDMIRAFAASSASTITRQNSLCRSVGDYDHVHQIAWVGKWKEDG